MRAISSNILEYQALLRRGINLSFVVLSTFLVLRFLFFLTNHSLEMLEELCYSSLFELISLNVLTAKYFKEESYKLNKILSTITWCLIAFSAYIVLTMHPQIRGQHFSSFGTLSLQGMMCFWLLSLALYFKDRILLSQSLSLGSLLLSLGSAIIHIFEIDLHRNLESFSGMNSLSTVFFILLSLGCFSLYGDKELMGLITKSTPFGKLVRKLFFISITVPTILGWLKIHFGNYLDTRNSGMTFFLTIFFVCFGITAYLWFSTLLLEKMNLEKLALENKLAQSEKNLRLALDSSKQGIWGFDSLLNELTFDDMAQKIVDTTQHEFLHELKRLLNREEKENVRIDLKVKENWIRFIGQKIYDQDGDYVSVAGTLQNVTSEKEVMEELKRNKETLRMALDAGGMGTFEWDIPSNKVFLSERSVEIYELDTKDSHQGFDLSTIQDLIDEEDLHFVSKSYEESLENHQETHQYEFRLKKGSRWLGYRGRTFFTEDHKAAKMIGVLFDESRLKNSLEVLKTEKNLREKFISTLSHDLKNVLNVGISYNQLIAKKTKEDTPLFQYAVKAEASMHRGVSMIKDLLDVNLIQQKGSFPIKEFSFFKISSFIDHLYDSFPDLENKLVIFAKEDFVVSWSEPDMKRVVENLIGNAHKYGEKQGKITVEFKHGQDHSLIRVHNDGEPIPQDVQTGLFDYLSRSRPGLGVEGWGIGLCIVKGIVEAHKGNVSITSDAHQGTYFDVSVPTYLH